MTSILALWTGLLVAFGGPVREVRITPTALTTDVLVSVEGTVESRHFTMEGPTRLVVDNSGPLEALDAEVDRAWPKILELATPDP